MSAVSDSKSKNVAATQEEERLSQAHQARKKNLKTAQKQEIDGERSRQRERLQELKDRHTSEVHKEKTTSQTLKTQHRKAAEENYRKAADERARHEATLKQQHAQFVQKQQHVNQKEQGYELQKREEQQKSTEAYKQHMREMKNSQLEQEAKQKEYHKMVKTTEQKEFEDYRKAQREHYTQEIKKEGDHFKTEMRHRHGDFETDFNKKELNYQLVLADQQQKYEEEFEKEKFKHLTKLDKYEAPKVDPFYKVKDMGAKMEDKGTHYEVRLQIPEHELRNFKVHVKDDKITVSGTRKHEEELNYAGEKIATNNFQTLRQEFLLEAPVDQDQVHKEYKDGMLFVAATKKGFGVFK